MPGICLFPGSFDPVTLGHVDVIDRALDLFDQLVIGVGVNSGKVAMFSVEQRVKWFREIYRNEPKVSVYSYEGLTVNFCRQVKARFILRGIRYVSDFEYEKAIADMNRRLDHEVETVFLTCSPEFSTVASTLVRDVIRHGGDASQFLPEPVISDLASLGSEGLKAKVEG
ncbi:pantetheine-phosphate adenylyltransferase [Compostibacter hankyongensis]|uniref:Phosphopantetheine adenylyltransferase n=1 Tax=Compostibacter hankyongensis TaxID=1007089 RepID=A0ABP8G777_9BACT